MSLGGGANAQASVTADQGTAFNQVLAAIGSAKAQVTWQSPPQSVKFAMVRRDFWNTGGVKVNYVGDVTITPTGPRQASVRVDCKPETLSTIISVGIGATLLGAFLNMQSGAGVFILLLGGVATAWSVYNLSNSVPKGIADKIVAGLQMAAYANANGAASQAYQPPPGQHAPPPPPPPGQYTPPPVDTPRPPETAGLVEQMKQLTQLRDMGAVTMDEFEAKKAEILKRL